MANGLEVVVARRASAPVVAVTLAARGGTSDAEPLGAANLAAFAGVRDGRHGLVETVGMSEYQWSDPAQLCRLRGCERKPVERARPAVRRRRFEPGRCWNRLGGRGLRSSARRAAVRAAFGARRPADAGGRVQGDAAGEDGFSRGRLPGGSGDANAWFERTWTPANSVLTIVGDVDPDVALLEAQSWMGWVGACREWLRLRPCPHRVRPPRPCHSSGWSGQTPSKPPCDSRASFRSRRAADFAAVHAPSPSGCRCGSIRHPARARRNVRIWKSGHGLAWPGATAAPRAPSRSEVLARVSALDAKGRGCARKGAPRSRRAGPTALARRRGVGLPVLPVVGLKLAPLRSSASPGCRRTPSSAIRPPWRH